MSNRTKGRALAQPSTDYKTGRKTSTRLVYEKKVKKPVRDEEAGEDGGGGSVVLAILLVVLGGILYGLLKG